MKSGASEAGRRSYRMTARAQAAEATGERILAAAWRAFSEQLFDQVTLQQIAAEAGVTVQTVLRRFGSKEELFAALGQREHERVLAERRPGTSTGGGLGHAIGVLVRHYDKDGRTMLSFLRQEDRHPVIAEVLALGRAEHRKWVEEHCDAILAGQAAGDRERLLTAAIAATDLYVWKLLRLDLGRSPEQVEETMLLLLEGLGPKKGAI